MPHFMATVILWSIDISVKKIKKKPLTNVLIFNNAVHTAHPIAIFKLSQDSKSRSSKLERTMLIGIGQNLTLGHLWKQFLICLKWGGGYKLQYCLKNV